jgi:hypothetical protein
METKLLNLNLNLELMQLIENVCVKYGVSSKATHEVVVYCSEVVNRIALKN